MAVGGMLLVILVLNVISTKAQYNSVRTGKTENDFVLHDRLKQSEVLLTFQEGNYLYGFSTY